MTHTKSHQEESKWWESKKYKS